MIAAGLANQLWEKHCLTEVERSCFQALSEPCTQSYHYRKANQAKSGIILARRRTASGISGQ
jgi:hypothetical protein